MRISDWSSDVCSSDLAWLPTGDYETKVALNDSWDVNFGADGAQNGANIPFSVPDDGNGGSDVTFFYDATSHDLTISPDAAPDPDPPQPQSVTIAARQQRPLAGPVDWTPHPPHPDPAVTTRPP